MMPPSWRQAKSKSVAFSFLRAGQREKRKSVEVGRVV